MHNVATHTHTHTHTHGRTFARMHGRVTRREVETSIATLLVISACPGEGWEEKFASRDNRDARSSRVLSVCVHGGQKVGRPAKMNGPFVI